MRDIRAAKRRHTMVCVRNRHRRMRQRRMGQIRVIRNRQAVRETCVIPDRSASMRQVRMR